MEIPTILDPTDLHSWRQVLEAEQPALFPSLKDTLISLEDRIELFVILLSACVEFYLFVT